MCFGHVSYNADKDDWYLSSFDVIENGKVRNVNIKRKSDRDEYLDLYRAYVRGKKLSGEKQAEAVVRYIVDTIGSTTVNAAESGGKTKYYIIPMENLVKTLEYNFYGVESNIGEVTTDNAVRPFITLSPIKGIDLQITLSRQGKTTYAVISNRNKTLLYLDAKRNLDKINDPQYFDNIATVVIADFQGVNKPDLTMNAVRAIDAYVDKWQPSLAKAMAEKSKVEEFNKRRELAAQQQAKQRERDAVRSQNIFKKQMDAALARKDYEEKLKQQKAEERNRLRDIKAKTDALRTAADETPSEFFDREVSDAFGGKAGMKSFIDGLVDRWDD